MNLIWGIEKIQGTSRICEKLKNYQIVKNNEELEKIIKNSGMKICEEKILNYWNFINIFSKAVLQTAFENLYEISKSNLYHKNKIFMPSIQFKPFDFKKGIYVFLFNLNKK